MFLAKAPRCGVKESDDCRVASVRFSLPSFCMSFTTVFSFLHIIPIHSSFPSFTSFILLVSLVVRCVYVYNPPSVLSSFTFYFSVLHRPFHLYPSSSYPASSSSQHLSAALSRNVSGGILEKVTEAEHGFVRREGVALSLPSLVKRFKICVSVFLFA